MDQEVFQKIVTHFSQGEFADELARAKDMYFLRTGKVFEDEPIFETRMTAFLEWYTLDRSLDHYGIPPVRLYELLFRDTMDAKSLNMVLALERTRHSLFFFQSRKAGQVFLEDVFDGSRLEVLEDGAYSMMEKGDIFDARVYVFEGVARFMHALWLHPRDVSAFILDESKKRRDSSNASKSDFLMDLSYMKLRFDRYKHRPASESYSFEALKRGREVSSAETK